MTFDRSRVVTAGHDRPSRALAPRLGRFDWARPRTVIVAAVLVGIVAGLGAALFHRIATEPRIDDAIAIEEATAAAADRSGDHAATDDADEVVITRATQQGAGLFAGYALIGAAFGLFLSVTALSLRSPGDDVFRRVRVAATILAGAITVAPWLKYPPNPPAVGDPSTVGARERWYVVLIVVVGLVLAGAAHLSARLRARGWPADRRSAAVAGGALVPLGLVVALLPSTPDALEVPANLVWQFRLSSLVGNLLLWALLTLGTGLVWAEGQRRAQAEVGAPAPEGAQNSMPLSAEIPAS